MLDDFTPQPRKKPNRIEPLPTTPKPPLPHFDDEVTIDEGGNEIPEKGSTSKNTVSDHQPKQRLAFFTTRWPLNRKWTIVGGVILFILLAGSITAAALSRPHATGKTELSKKPVAPVKPPAVIYSTLSGLPVSDASVNQRPVTGVMVENSIDARPQSGLSQAGVVFEAIAEGGVTRFMALYQDQTPDNVGPIRSARPYYIQWDLGFDAAYAHVGGSPDALNDITAWGVKDLNQFYNGGSYHRVTSRAAPHNVYTGIGTLNQLETSKGYTSSTYSGFTRKSDQAYVAATPTSTSTTKSAAITDSRTPANSIDFAISGAVYNPHYDYVAITNSYNRSEGGAVQTDANSGKQLSPKVVISIIVPKAQGALDASGAYYSNYTVTGSGQAYIFQDGTVVNATWSKPDMKSQITFSDSAGKPIALNRGQTWITALTATSQSVYK